MSISTRTSNPLPLFQRKYWSNPEIFTESVPCIEELYNRLANPLEKESNLTISDQETLQATPLKSEQKGSLNTPSSGKRSHAQFVQEKETEETPRLCDLINISELDLSRRKFKIIDYGNCYDYSDKRQGLIGTRQYRAPEVMLSKSLFSFFFL